MRRPAVVLLPLVLLLAGCSHSAAKSARSSASPTTTARTVAPTPSPSAYPESRCDGNTMEMDECVAAVRDQVERELNAVYTRVRRELLAREADGEFADIDEAHESVHPAEELRQAERAFLVYRDRMCGATYDTWITGTIRTLSELGCELAVTRSQIDSIKALADP